MRKFHKVYDFRCHTSASELYRQVALRWMYENKYGERHTRRGQGNKFFPSQ